VSFRFINLFPKHSPTVSAGETLKRITFFPEHNLTVSAGESLRCITFFPEHNLTVSAGESLRCITVLSITLRFNHRRCSKSIIRFCWEDIRVQIEAFILPTV
jgi:hypothetical protein